MTELKSPTENPCSAKLSQEEIQIPLSPVLGSGQSLKKLFKNRKERQKRDSNRVVQKLDNIIKPQDETDKNYNSVQLENSALQDDSMLQDFQELEKSTSNIDPIAGPSEPRLSVDYNRQDMSENLWDRIRILEDFETKKSNIIRAISFNKRVNVDATLETISVKVNDDLDQIHVENDFTTNKEESFQKYAEELKTNVFLNKVNKIAQFQTCAGKGISISEDDLKKSTKLFEDILYPSDNSQSSRKNKFNYLGKYGSSEKCSVSKILHSETRCTIKHEPTISTRTTKTDLIPTMKFDSVQVKSDRKNFKNIFEGENFGDLKLLQNSGFKVASVSLEEDKTRLETEYQEKLLQKSMKNTFKGKNCDDLELFQSSSFNTESVRLKHEKPEERSCQKPVKMIFDVENVDNIKLFQNSGFSAASMSLRNGMTNIRSETATILPLKNTVGNIFGDENFDDLKISQDSGFKAASSLKINQVVKISNKELQENPPQKLVKNIFKENFDDLEVPNKSGFQPASISFKDEKDLSRAANSCANSTKKPSKNIFEGENFSDLNCKKSIGFKPALVSLKSLPNSTKTDPKPVEVFPCGNNLKEGTFNKHTIKNQGFKRALLPDANTLEPSVKRPFRNIFEDEKFDDLNINLRNLQGFKEGPGNLGSSSSSMAKLNQKGFRNIFEGENFDDLNLGALGPKFQSPMTSSKINLVHNRTFESPFKTPAKNDVVEQNTDNQLEENFYGFNNEEKKIALNISESNCDIVNIIEDRFKIIKSQHNPSEPLINLSNIDNLSKKVYSNKLKVGLEYNLNLGKKRKFSELDSDHNSPCLNSLSEQNTTGGSGTPLQKSFLKRPKKRLGCHFSPTIQVSETVLKKAKLLFEDLEHRPRETSTPVRFERSLATPLGCGLTPIQGIRRNLGGRFLEAARRSGGFSRSLNSVTLDQTLIKNNARFGLNKPSEGDVKVWMENLSSERRLLEEMLRIVDERQTILSNQRTILEFSEKGKKRILPGVLYKSKTRKVRMCLKDLSVNPQSEQNSTINVLHQVNPQNAHLVHFYMENKRVSHLQTQDGAVLVLTTGGRIGISEIEHSFKVMDGVDPNLIPKGWIQNHYKWIIWKLASYERMFLDGFKECLSVENVVQQLKYRYDIEIDQVKRSALHKIFEKDDCSQRRLVLCVSKIMKVNNTYDLELTDGWYPIRTVIDPLLCDQILKGKIKLGVKLMTYGAELMNCEGCHPLEATERMFLKINFNSTRRAAWWSKLGCQKESGPFLVPLSSVNMEGGKIGCIKCFIARVYPVKYMEKYGNKNVWRNRKAEERRQQEFNNEKTKCLERTNDGLYREHCNYGVHSKRSDPDELKSIRSVDDPETLYYLLQKSSDPESIQENLSSTQKTLLYSFSLNKSAQDQSKLFNQLNEKAGIFQERSVTSLLKIKIVDARSGSDVGYDFHVWRPQETYLQELREGEVVTIFNASCSLKWGLSSGRTTQFKLEQKPKDDRYQKFRRKVTSIEQLQTFSKKNLTLTEFDTVGIVVKKKVGDHQQVWLTDCQERLLFIKINDSPKNVLVLDAVNEGQIITVCNLVFKHSCEEYAFSVADHFVIFSRYSQYRHLQEAAESLEKELSNGELTGLLQVCHNKVDKIETKWDCKNPKLVWDTDDMDCSQITTTDLALLECVDKLT